LVAPELSVPADSVAIMPSDLHEMLVELFRARPTLVADLLGGLIETPLPAFARARVSAADLGEIKPVEYRADAVITFEDDVGRPTLAVIIEVQLAADARKHDTWPVYLINERARRRCPALLVVVCPTQPVADWCATPIPTGHPGFVLTPLVLGPAAIALVTDPGLVRTNLELAVLSVVAHGETCDDEVVLAMLAEFRNIDHDRATVYADLVLKALPKSVWTRLEEQMTTTDHPFQSEFARRYYDRGEVRGEARALLGILDARGLSVSDELRATITSCTDLDQLDRWVRRAVTVTQADELLDETRFTPDVEP
jgi:hypothetical protein